MYRSKFSLFFFLLFVCSVQSCTSDYTENLGNGYFYWDEGGSLQDILCERANGVEVPAKVLGFAYNRKFILAKQRPDIPGDPLYKNTYESNSNGIYYWIIVKEKDSLFGPLNIEQFNSLRSKYKIDKNLHLK